MIGNGSGATILAAGWEYAEEISKYDISDQQ
jgi:hypothetical protein